MATNHEPVEVNPEIVQAHTAGWHSFTKFLTIGTICVIVVLAAFVLQFSIGWGYAALFMVLGFTTTAILALLGKL